MVYIFPFHHSSQLGNCKQTEPLQSGQPLARNERDEFVEGLQAVGNPNTSWLQLYSDTMLKYIKDVETATCFTYPLIFFQDLRDPAKRRGEVGNANSYQFLRTKTLILPPSNFFLLFTMTTSSVDNGSLLYYCTYFVGACAYLFATYRSIVINKVEEYK